MRSYLNAIAKLSGIAREGQRSSRIIKRSCLNLDRNDEPVLLKLEDMVLTSSLDGSSARRSLARLAVTALIPQPNDAISLRSIEVLSRLGLLKKNL